MAARRFFRQWRTPTSESSLFKTLETQSPCPPYPYGPNLHYRDANGGLYGGANIQHGNKISKGRNKGKTLRRWYPNVRQENIRSEALDRTMTIRITASAMRTIRKAGGLDQYLLGAKPARIKELGVFGWRLRWQVMNSPSMKERFRRERENLGLPPAVEGGFDTVWAQDAELRQEVQAEQEGQWATLREADERFRRHVERNWEPKDHRKYRKVDLVPGFNTEAFRSLTLEPAQSEQTVQS